MQTGIYDFVVIQICTKTSFKKVFDKIGIREYCMFVW